MTQPKWNAKVTITNRTLSGNIAVASGGRGIYNASGSLTINNSSFSNRSLT